MTLDPRTSTAADVSSYFLQTSLWPAVVYTVVLMISGTMGNILVLLVYRRHFRRSVTRMFIFTLAALDLGSCLLAMPSELMILFNFVSFPSSGYCKASRFLTYIFNGSSSAILIAIAMDRFHKVCRPYKVFITIPRAKKICIGVIAATALFSIPSLVIYGNARFALLVKDGHAQILPIDTNNVSWLPDGWHIKGGLVIAESDTIDAERFMFRSQNVTDGSIGQSMNEHKYVYVDSLQLQNTYVEDNINGSEKTEVRKLSDHDQTIPFDFSVIAGELCLVSAQDSVSPLAIIFYAYTFLYWLVLLVLVIYFYSRVAHTMFLLRSIHKKMFSWADRGVERSPSRRSVTPRTASLIQGDATNNVYFQQEAEPGADIAGLEGKKAHENSLPTEPVVLLSHKPSNNGLGTDNDKPFLIQNSASETQADKSVKLDNEYSPDDKSICGKEQPNNEMKHEETKENSEYFQTVSCTDHYKSQSDCSSVDNRITPSGSNQTSANSLNVMYDHNNSDLQCQYTNESNENARCQSLDDVLLVNRENKSTQEFFDIKTEQKQRETSIKVPKIEIQTTEDLQPESTNSLLMRRIKSLENVNSTRKIDFLQIPSNRKRTTTMSGDIAQGRQQRSHGRNSPARKNTECIGELSHSDTSLDVSTEMSGNPDELGDAKKTMTLTRSSARGKKNVFVLPLTGLATKTAIHNHECQSQAHGRSLPPTKTATLPSSMKYSANMATTLYRGARRGSGIDTLENPAALERERFKYKMKFDKSLPLKENENCEDEPSNAGDGPSDLNNGNRTTIVFNADYDADQEIKSPRPNSMDILSERHRRASVHPVRTSRMLFIISLVFLVSFLPFFVIVLRRSDVGSSHFLSSLNLQQLGVINVFVRSTLLSNAINPLIYGMLSTHFRRECTGLVCCIFSGLRRSSRGKKY